jgi:hypothetical protein
VLFVNFAEGADTGLRRYRSRFEWLGVYPRRTSRSQSDRCGAGDCLECNEKPLGALRARPQITWTFARLGLGALRRCQWLVWLATRHHRRLALHPNPAVKCPSYSQTSPKGRQRVEERLVADSGSQASLGRGKPLLQIQRLSQIHVKTATEVAVQLKRICLLCSGRFHSDGWLRSSWLLGGRLARSGFRGRWLCSSRFSCSRLGGGGLGNSSGFSSNRRFSSGAR